MVIKSFYFCCMAEKKKILIVDDEQDILEFLSYNLQKEGFIVDTADNGFVGISKAKEFMPHLILLDIMMPDMDGIETCYELRKLEECEHTLIAFLTARGEDYSQIAGFEAGADDYVIKPIKPKVLISRLNALLKRYSESSEIVENTTETDKKPEFIISKERYTVYNEGEEIFLPKKEFELLAFIASKPNRLFTREEIFNHVWGAETVVGDRTIDVHIRKLRSKIGEKYIKTIKGVGYKFVN